MPHPQKQRQRQRRCQGKVANRDCNPTACAATFQLSTEPICTQFPQGSSYDIRFLNHSPFSVTTETRDFGQLVLRGPRNCSATECGVLTDFSVLAFHIFTKLRRFKTARNFNWPRHHHFLNALLYPRTNGIFSDRPENYKASADCNPLRFRGFHSWSPRM